MEKLVVLEPAVDLENADRITRMGAGRGDDRLSITGRRVRVRPGVVKGDDLEIGVGGEEQEVAPRRRFAGA